MEYTSKEQIISKCREIKGKKIKDIISHKNDFTISKDKGKIGNLIQREVFNIEINNDSFPDFKKLGIELKVTGLIKYRKDAEGRKYRAKERISLGMINYHLILDEDSFEKSHIYFKVKKTLYIFYEYRYDKPMLEWKIIDYKYVDLEKSINDVKILAKDYATIYSKIKEGRAEELSESLTQQLGACTKGTGKQKLVNQPKSDELVKPRAFSWKPSYVNKIFHNDGDEILESEIMNFIVDKIQPFMGKSIDRIYKENNIKIPNSKNQKQKIINKIMNTSKYSEIPNIRQSSFKIKNIELKENGILKEEIGLINVNQKEFIDNISFEESELYNFLISYKFLFIVWEQTKTIKSSGLKDIIIFEFDSQLIEKARLVYEDTKEKFLNGMEIEIKNGNKNSNLIHKSDNKGFHLRPHGKDGKDTIITPFGQEITNQQYWLNGNEVQDVITTNKIY